MGADDPRARWFSVFASVMRLMGAALIAAFTAILTNYLLRARLAGALEFRRIPDGDARGGGSTAPVRHEESVLHEQSDPGALRDRRAGERRGRLDECHLLPGAIDEIP